ncbi:MAG: DUF4382 domain-containing protein [Deltaproteobacteria bacterium]|nr:DUF4382 domain-containing protein [Deltaproteobacteria bacterium]
MKTKLKNLISIISVILIFAGLGLAGCTGGSAGETGDVVVGLTDAAGDFNSYTVDVTSVTLKKADGTTVETLPQATTVDFAQYTDMTEFLTAQTVPAGVYTEMTMTLDYMAADIQVEDDSGASVPADVIVDEDGTTVTTLTLDVTFSDTDRLVVAPGIPAHMTLDFDLASSNQVKFDGNGSPTVTVSPTLSADINPKAPKLHRLRGPVKDVSLDDSSFTIVIRPFYHKLTRDNDRRFGMMTVKTDAETVYDIDGTTYTGAPGLEALSGLDALTGAVVLGDLVFADGALHFEANEVRAGSSIPGGAMDMVSGNVISANADDNTVTLRGAVFMRKSMPGFALRHIAINHDVTVALGEGTIIRRQLSTDTYYLADIGVGQRLTVFGEATTNEDGTLEQIDASNGYVWMKLSTVRGSVVSVDTVSDDPTPLEIKLQSVDNRLAGAFAFGDAVNPDQLQIAIGNLDLSGIDVGAVIKLRGFFTPAGTGDFEAQTIINVTQSRATLMTTWQPASDMAFTSVAGTGITLDFTNAGQFHHVNRGWVVTDLEDLDTAPVIAPPEDGAGRFLILQPGGMISNVGPVRFYDNYADFAAELNARLDNGAAVRQILARGSFDDASATMTADVIEVHLQ